MMVQPGDVEAPEWCPGCGSRDLRAVWDAEGNAGYLCRTCAACWHTRGESVGRVDPDVCPGCSSKAVCDTALVPYPRKG